MSTTVVGLSLNRELVKEIDRRRGDVPRSRYINRLLENSVEKEKGESASTAAPSLSSRGNPNSTKAETPS